MDADHLLSEIKPIQSAGVEVNVITLPAGYNKQHYWKAGQLIFCLEGTVTIVFDLIRKTELRGSQSFTITGNVSSMIESGHGAKVIVVDSKANTKSADQIRNPWRM